jgi:hypothetical protein
MPACKCPTIISGTLLMKIADIKVIFFALSLNSKQNCKSFLKAIQLRTLEVLWAKQTAPIKNGSKLIEKLNIFMPFSFAINHLLKS